MLSLIIGNTALSDFRYSRRKKKVGVSVPLSASILRHICKVEYLLNDQGNLGVSFYDNSYLNYSKDTDSFDFSDCSVYEDCNLLLKGESLSTFVDELDFYDDNGNYSTSENKVLTDFLSVLSIDSNEFFDYTDLSLVTFFRDNNARDLILSGDTNTNIKPRLVLYYSNCIVE